MVLGIPAKIYLKVFPVCYCLLKIISTAKKFRYLVVT